MRYDPVCGCPVVAGWSLHDHHVCPFTPDEYREYAARERAWYREEALELLSIARHCTRSGYRAAAETYRLRAAQMRQSLAALPTPAWMVAA